MFMSRDAWLYADCRPLLQVRNPTTATSAAPSSTDRPTLRRTPASTLGKSRTSARPAAPDLSRLEELWKPVFGNSSNPGGLAVILILCPIWLPSLWLPSGGPLARPRAHPHRREAVPLRDLRHALPPPADTQEPHAHSYGREALSCKLPSPALFS